MLEERIKQVKEKVTISKYFDKIIIPDKIDYYSDYSNYLEDVKKFV